jgi:hypothetical protein
VERRVLSKVYLIESKRVVVYVRCEASEKKHIKMAGWEQDVIENKWRQNVSFGA